MPLPGARSPVFCTLKGGDRAARARPRPPPHLRRRARSRRTHRLLTKERAEKQSLALQLRELEQVHDDAAMKLQQLTTARFFARQRLLRELRKA